MAWRDATASSGVESAPALCETAVRALAAGQASRATGRLGPMDQNTGGEWRHRAALHGHSVAWDFGGPLHGTAGPLDALWGVVHTQEAPLPCAPLACETSGDAGVG